MASANTLTLINCIYSPFHPSYPVFSHSLLHFLVGDGVFTLIKGHYPEHNPDYLKHYLDYLKHYPDYLKDYLDNSKHYLDYLKHYLDYPEHYLDYLKQYLDNPEVNLNYSYSNRQFIQSNNKITVWA